LVRGSTTTVYLEGVWEEIAGGVTQIYYMFNGQVVAVRDSSTSAVTYLHNDHLGSVSVATTSGGALASQQEFYPWGTHRGSGDITQTTLDFTGQRLDGSGLLYYHARKAIGYNPLLGRNQGFEFSRAVSRWIFRIEEFGFDVFQPDTLPSPKLRPCALDTLEKPWIGFKVIVEQFLLIRKAVQEPDRLSILEDQNIFLFSQFQVVRDIML